MRVEIYKLKRKSAKFIPKLICPCPSIFYKFISTQTIEKSEIFVYFVHTNWLCIWSTTFNGKLKCQIIVIHVDTWNPGCIFVHSIPKECIYLSHIFSLSRSSRVLDILRPKIFHSHPYTFKNSWEFYTKINPFPSMISQLCVFVYS